MTGSSRTGSEWHETDAPAASVGQAVTRAVTSAEARLEARAEALVEHLVPRLRGVLHEIAFAVSLVTGTALVCLAPSGLARTAALVYAVSVTLLFGTSAALHRRRWSPRAEVVMARLDHSMIFVLIAGTYTPFGLLLLDGAARWTVLGIVWGGALAGVLLRLLLGPHRWLFTGLYLGLGWVAVAFLPQLARAGGVTVVVLLLVGGLLYSAGGVVYATRRPDPSPRWFGFHEVFHAFTLAAFVAHYVAVSFATYRAA